MLAMATIPVKIFTSKHVKGSHPIMSIIMLTSNKVIILMTYRSSMTSDNQNDVIALGNMIFDSKKVQILKLNNIFKY